MAGEEAKAPLVRARVRVAGSGSPPGPAGAYVINNGEVTWQPAVDVNRVVAVGGAVAMVAFLTLRSIVRARAKARRAQDRSRTPRAWT